MSTKKSKATATTPVVAPIVTVPQFSAPQLMYEGPLEVGLDIGFGVTKIITYINGQYVQAAFPSVATHAHKIRYNADKTSAKYPGEQISVEDGEYFVGNLALSQGDPAELLRLDGRTGNDDSFGMSFRRMMMQVALAKILPYHEDEVIYIVINTGLPVAHMQDAPLLKKALSGVYHIRTNNASFTVHVTEVRVMPQPYGSLYSQQINPDGTMNALHVAEVCSVVDVGFFTVDLTLDKSTEYIDEQSDSVAVGIHVAHRRLTHKMDAHYRTTFPSDVIDDLLRTGKVKVRNKPMSHHEDVAEALQPVIDAVIAAMNRLWESGIFIDVIYVVGGGAAVVIDAIKKVYPHAVMLADAQMSNARGYLHYGNFIARQ
jgi:plasmid segregation protein ParM